MFGAPLRRTLFIRVVPNRSKREILPKTAKVRIPAPFCHQGDTMEAGLPTMSRWHPRYRNYRIRHLTSLPHLSTLNPPPPPSLPPLPPTKKGTTRAGASWMSQRYHEARSKLRNCLLKRRYLSTLSSLLRQRLVPVTNDNIDKFGHARRVTFLCIPEGAEAAQQQLSKLVRTLTTK